LETLEFLLLGIPKILRGNAVVGSRTRRVVALLAYLVLEPESHSRDKLANLLWADAEPDAARNNLRNALSHVRAVIGEALTTNRFDVSLEPQVNVDFFKLELLEQNPNASREALEMALKDVKGVLLEGIEFQDTPDWQAWLELKRQRIQAVIDGLLERLCSLQEQEGDIKAALETTRKRLTLDDLNEDAHRNLIRLELARGQRSAALEALERCRQVLFQELGVAPSKETLALLEQPSQTQAPVPVLLESEKPALMGLTQSAALVGRMSEWAELEAAWGEKMFIFVVGEPGSGKSRLIEEFVKAKTGKVADADINGRPDDPHVPYSTIARALRKMFKLFPNPPLAPWVYQELGRILPDLATQASNGVSGEALRLSEALSEFMLHFGRRFQLWVTDDLQFYDEATWQSATHAWYRTTTEWMSNGGKPPTLIAAYRTGEMSQAGETLMQIGLDAGIGVRIELKPLGTPSIQAMLEQFEPNLSDTFALATQLERLTGGNPMLLLETLKSLRETNELENLNPNRLEQLRERRELPRSSKARRVIEPRLERLSKAANDLARVIAIAGEHFTLELAQTVLETSSANLLAASEELERAGIVRETRFAHDLLLETVFEKIPSMSKRILHHRVLDHLEHVSTRAGVLYQHALLSGEARAIAKHGILAALEARSLGLPEEALNMLRQASSTVHHATLDARLLEDALRLSQELQDGNLTQLFEKLLQPHLQQMPS
jgi:DNA-binding SARP family transcriptional activator